MTRRCLFRLIAILSVLLCVASIAMWVRSESYYDGGPFDEHWNAVQLDSINGEFAITIHWPVPNPHAGLRIYAETAMDRIMGYRYEWGLPTGNLWQHEMQPTYLYAKIPQAYTSLPYNIRSFDLDDNCRSWLGVGGRDNTFTFHQMSGNPDVAYRFVTLVFPYWLSTILTLLVPTIWLNRYLRRRKRIAAGKCEICGYNLTGNASGVCPECGAAVPKKAEGFA